MFAPPQYDRNARRGWTVLLLVALILCAVSRVSFAQGESLAPPPVDPNAEDDNPIGWASPWTVGDSRWTYGGFYATAEAIFIAPRHSNTNSNINVSDPVASNNVAIGSSTESQYLGLSPRFSVGYAGERGWGLRCVYWMVNTSSCITTPGAVLGTSNTCFTAQTIDLEVTRQLFLPFGGSALTTFGVRNGGVYHSETQSLSGYIPNTTDLVSGTASTSSQFYGTGLTGCTQWLRPLYRGQRTDLGFYGAYRGSTLWGTQASTAATSAQVTSGGVVYPSAYDFVPVYVHNTMFVNELQAGLQWSRSLARWRNNRVFARVVFEYQNWTIASGAGAARASVSAGIPGVTESIVAAAEARALQSVNLLGVGVTAGCYW